MFVSKIHDDINHFNSDLLFGFITINKKHLDALITAISKSEFKPLLNYWVIFPACVTKQITILRQTNVDFAGSTYYRTHIDARTCNDLTTVKIE